MFILVKCNIFIIFNKNNINKKLEKIETRIHYNSLWRIPMKKIELNNSLIDSKKLLNKNDEEKDMLLEKPNLEV